MKTIRLVAGFSGTLQPKIWDPNSSYFIPEVQAIMVSYANFHGHPIRRRKAMEQGLHGYLGAPKNVKIFLDNGSFYFSKHGIETSRDIYEEFVKIAKPDWWPIPQDFIPHPEMTRKEQRSCFQRTMELNKDYQENGYVPVIHISQFLEHYVKAIQASDKLSAKPNLALGGLVPNLLCTQKATAYKKILLNLKYIREAFSEKNIHVFGVGGIATLHLTALLGIDSVDSTGWRNRAARGIVQLPGSGDRIIAELGSWHIPQPNPKEWELLSKCPCPACQQYGIKGLKARGNEGFCNRAVHNIWILLKEGELIKEKLNDESYSQWYKTHLNNSKYRPLIDQLVTMML